MLVIVVSNSLRRAFDMFLRPHLPDAFVLGLNDLPETRRIGISRSIDLPDGLTPPALQKG